MISPKAYNRIQRDNDKRRNPERYTVTDSPETRRRVINEHACDEFVFIVKVPNARYAHVIKLSKAMLIRYADRALYPSTVGNGEQKRDESGKPCYRFNAEFIRSCIPEEKRLDFGGRTWAAWCKAVRAYATRHNAGCEAEKQVCELFGWTQIGEIDRKGHMAHCDAVDAGAIRYEIKLETGYIASQFWTGSHEWAQA